MAVNDAAEAVCRAEDESDVMRFPGPDAVGNLEGMANEHDASVAMGLGCSFDEIPAATRVVMEVEVNLSDDDVASKVLEGG